TFFQGLQSRKNLGPRPGPVPGTPAPDAAPSGPQEGKERTEYHGLQLPRKYPQAAPGPRGFSTTRNGLGHSAQEMGVGTIPALPELCKRNFVQKEPGLKHQAI